MLLSFGAKNFYSFKEGFDVSLENKNEIITVLGIKGANASGKTNVIKALFFIRLLMSRSFEVYKPESKILINSFFDSQEPIEMYLHFKVDDIEYKYEISLIKDKILKETLSKKENRWVRILEREENKIVYATTDYKKIKELPINRSNASIISIAHQFGLKELDVYYNFSQKIIVNVGMLGKLTNDEHLLSYETITKFYKNNNKLLKSVVALLKNADTGISDIKVIELKDDKTNETIYEAMFIHIVNGEEKILPYDEESTGVKILYRQLGLYLSAILEGYVVAFDEFDVNIHPDLLPMIIELFENKDFNKKGAQLIFTSHHTEIIDRLGKYRIIFVNKEDNESYLYRLDEIPGNILRPDRSIIPAYNSYKIGGRPKVING